MSKILKSFYKFCNGVERVEMIIGLTNLGVFFLFTCYQVIARIIGVNAAFTQELANYNFIWLTFLGASLMLRHNEHFRFSALSDHLKGVPFFINEVVILVVLLLFSGMVALHGVTLTQKFWGWKFSSIPWLSLGWAWLCVPIGGFTATLFSVENLIKFLVDPSSRMAKSDIEEEVA